jgi:hypothetical protein
LRRWAGGIGVKSVVRRCLAGIPPNESSRSRQAQISRGTFRVMECLRQTGLDKINQIKLDISKYWYFYLTVMIALGFLKKGADL